MLLQQYILNMWNNKYKKYYMEKGYKFTGRGNIFYINVKDLLPHSKKNVLVMCDNCNNIYISKFVNISSKKEHYCKQCNKYYSNQKREKTCLEKYNVKNINQLEEIRDKSKKTCLKKYGYINPNKSIIVKNKIKQTNIKKYGVKCTLQYKEIKNKAKQTFIKKYGVDNPWKSKEIQNKIRIKANITIHKNNTAPCSKQQQYIYNLLYKNNFECKLNYPVNKCLLDIAFPKEKIYIEYDGGGHDLRIKHGMPVKEFKQKEMNRQYYLKSLGWKLIRIKCPNDILPIKNEIINEIIIGIEYLLSGNKSWYKIIWNY